MTPAPALRSQSSRNPAGSLTIRAAVATDAAALGRLAELDSAPRPEPVPTLIAEVGGELHAALPLDGGRAIADPFRRTAELVGLLTERARQLELSAARDARRGGARRTMIGGLCHWPYTCSADRTSSATASAWRARVAKRLGALPRTSS